MNIFSTFEILPDEIILYICRYLRGADVLYSLYNINTRLNITIAGYCRYMTLMTVPYKQFEYIVTHILPSIGHHVQSFILNMYWEKISNQLSTLLFTSRLSFLCPQLQKLTLQYFSSERLLSFIDSLDNFPQLNTLKFRSLFGYTTDVLLPKLFSANNYRLRILSFDQDSIKISLSEAAAVISYPNVEELTINIARFQTLPRLFKLVPNIRRLCVSIDGRSDGSESKEEFKNLSSLVHLIDFHLRSIRCFWTLEEIANILQLMPSLERLTLDLCTEDKHFLNENDMFMILPSSCIHVNLFIAYYFSELTGEVPTSQSVHLSTACLLDGDQYRLIMHTIPCNLYSMALPASIGKQMIPGWTYTQQVADLNIYDATHFLEILHILQHFRRIQKLSITTNNKSEILSMPSSMQSIVLKLPLLNQLVITGMCPLFHLLDASPNLEHLIIDFDCLKASLDDEPTCHLLETRIVRLHICNWIDSESNLIERIIEVFRGLRILWINMTYTASPIDSFVLKILSLWKRKSKISLGVSGSLSGEANKNLRRWIIDHFSDSIATDSFAVEYKGGWFNLWF